MSGLNPDISSLYSRALPTFRSGLFYNTYAYPTKIAPESIAVYIAAHTKPGDTVLDAFAGSGATGLAALMCEHPTESMIRIARDLGVNPVWGPRNASLYDISTYGCFAAQIMTNPPESAEFARAANELLSRAETALGQLYNTLDDCGEQGTLRHLVWSSVLSCPCCDEEFSFYSGMVHWNPLRIQSSGRCPHCGAEVTTQNCKYTTDVVWDSLLGHNVTFRKRVPVLVYGETNGRKWRRGINDTDLSAIEEINSLEMPGYCSPKPIRWGELYRSGYHQGITHLHHFYTKRNYLVLSYLWKECERFTPAIRDALRLLILSYNETHSTLMTRVVAKHGSKDFVLTGSQSGVLYISNLPVEKNILKGLSRKVGSFLKAFSYVRSCSGKVSVHNVSSSQMFEADDSISYVFTDPPFGDFIPYAEVNQINELWLDSVTNRTGEAIISPSQGKDVDDYQRLLTQSFSEVRRVLKDEGLMTLIFHSSKAKVWNALACAIDDAGFNVDATSHLDRAQSSFKQVVSSSSVKNDALILLSKKRSDLNAIVTGSEFDALRCLRNQASPELAYSEYASYCLKHGIEISLDASEAYKLVPTKG
ncbi:DNA methylase [Enorma sp. HF-1365]|uniref:DNA methylase n=1 Tax=Enorma shizhengliae TaxID=2606615 RepID=A0A7K0G9R9_9ACTN|nr:DNA methylase [Enorma shizhengliae]